MVNEAVGRSGPAVVEDKRAGRGHGEAEDGDKGTREHDRTGICGRGILSANALDDRGFISLHCGRTRQPLAERSFAHDRTQLRAPLPRSEFAIGDSPTFGCRAAIKRSNSTVAVCESTTCCDPQRGAARLVDERGWMHARICAPICAYSCRHASTSRTREARTCSGAQDSRSESNVDHSLIKNGDRKRDESFSLSEYVTERTPRRRCQR
jgi:hypothetical protein